MTNPRVSVERRVTKYTRRSFVTSDGKKHLTQATAEAHQQQLDWNVVDVASPPRTLGELAEYVAALLRQYPADTLFEYDAGYNSVTFNVAVPAPGVSAEERQPYG